MSTGTRLAAFVAGLAVVFAGAVGVGRLAGPAAAVDPPPTHAADAAAGHGDAEPGAGGDGGATDDGHGAGDGAADGSGHGAGDGDEPAEHEVGTPGGLQVSERGYTLRLAAPTAPAGRGELAFAVTGPDGRPVTAYRTEHDKELHLIVVRRDLAGYRHLHPTRDAAGTWRTPVDLTPGTYRVFADFVPAAESEGLTLGADLTVPGTLRPRPLPPPAATTTVDGYRVALTGELRAGAASPVTLTVTRAGAPVRDLQPYLGAYGHLVALRAGDLAYLHVHPEGTPGDGRTAAGPGIAFVAEVPSAGAYRLYLDFRHGGVVRTAELTVVAR